VEEKMEVFRGRALLLALSLLAVTAPIAARASQTAPAIAAFDAAFDKTTSFTYELHSQEKKGDAVQNRVYDYSFMKPHFAKTLISGGDGRGSGGVWTGGDQVSGHQGGFLSGIHLKVGLHDGRAVSLRGYTIPDGLPQNIVATYQNVKGDLKEYNNAGAIDGAQTDLLDLKVADPASNGGISEQKLYLSQKTHFPVRQILYEGSNIVLDQSFTNWNLDAHLSQSDFPF
jgi:outer membrane lipoprotein-sorting protein